jgi:hypothetical protein
MRAHRHYVRMLAVQDVPAAKTILSPDAGAVSDNEGPYRLRGSASVHGSWARTMPSAVRRVRRARAEAE